jgi:hypothetical protein
MINKYQIQDLIRIICKRYNKRMKKLAKRTQFKIYFLYLLKISKIQKIFKEEKVFNK